MDVVGKIGTQFSLQAKPSQLKITSLLSLLFLLMLTLEILLLTYITGGKVVCLRADADLDDLIEKKDILYGDVNAFINQTCGSDIKAKSTLLYVLIIVHATFSIVMMGIIRSFLWRVNCYECILQRQKISEMMGDTVVERGAPYHQRLKRVTRVFLLVLVGMAAVYFAVFILLVGVESWNPSVRTILRPGMNFCNGTALVFSKHRKVNFQCHFESEMLIYYLDMIVTVLQIAFGLVLLFTTLSLWLYHRKLRTISFTEIVENTDDAMTIGFIKPET
eukprot:gnl/Trimastix_PCT/1933.p1 GENE.gnl/Trimastix_PCT/1933~~gnl/Trimastix_PCT/1933.p1  ORF type:complete len:276 (+),score=42.54 gnl/Trimastix_PCT/1933:78-905(+)